MKGWMENKQRRLGDSKKSVSQKTNLKEKLDSHCV